jgi:hypothetical protein
VALLLPLPLQPRTFRNGIDAASFAVTGRPFRAASWQRARPDGTVGHGARRINVAAASLLEPASELGVLRLRPARDHLAERARMNPPLLAVTRDSDQGAVASPDRPTRSKNRARFKRMVEGQAQTLTARGSRPTSRMDRTEAAPLGRSREKGMQVDFPQGRFCSVRLHRPDSGQKELGCPQF